MRIINAGICLMFLISTANAVAAKKDDGISYLPKAGEACELSRCKEYSRTPGYKECAKNLAVEQDKALKEKLKELMAISDTSQRKFLRDEQKAWLKYKKKYDRFSLEYFSETAHMYRMECNVNRHKASEFNQFVEDFRYKSM